MLGNEQYFADAEVAYDAYRAHTGGVSLASGHPIPEWSSLRPDIQEAWVASARALKEPMKVALRAEEVISWMEASLFAHEGGGPSIRIGYDDATRNYVVGPSVRGYSPYSLLEALWSAKQIDPDNKLSWGIRHAEKPEEVLLQRNLYLSLLTAAKAELRAIADAMALPSRPPCDECDGKGMVRELPDIEWMNRQVCCPTCGGSGQSSEVKRYREAVGDKARLDYLESAGCSTPTHAGSAERHGVCSRTEKDGTRRWTARWITSECATLREAIDLTLAARAKEVS